VPPGLQNPVNLVHQFDKTKSTSRHVDNPWHMLDEVESAYAIKKVVLKRYRLYRQIGPKNPVIDILPDINPVDLLQGEGVLWFRPATNIKRFSLHERGVLD
jgi:hypothetical protein